MRILKLKNSVFSPRKILLNKNGSLQRANLENQLKNYEKSPDEDEKLSNCNSIKNELVIIQVQIMEGVRFRIK